MYLQTRLKAFESWAFAVLVQKHQNSIYQRIVHRMSNRSLLACFHVWCHAIASNHPEIQLEDIESKIDATTNHLQALHPPPNFVFYAAYYVLRQEASAYRVSVEGAVLGVIGLMSHLSLDTALRAS